MTSPRVPVCACVFAAREPRREAAQRELRQRALAGDAEHALGEHLRRRQAAQQVRERRDSLPDAAEPGDLAERAGAQRQAVLLVVLAQHLGLQLGHVHVRGALGLAGLALDAEVHRVVEALAGEFIGGELAADDHAEHRCAGAGGVLLLARRHEGGAHAAVQFAARALAVAHLHVRAEAAVLAEVEVGRHVDGLVAGADAQVLPQAGRLDDLAGVHDAVGVERLLQLLERLIELGAEHLLREDAAHDAVAVLAGEAAAELEHEVGDLLCDRGHLLDALVLLEVDDGTYVQAAGGRVAVVGGLGVVLRDDLLEAAHVLRQLLRRDGGVLHVRQRLGVALEGHRQPQPRLAERVPALLLDRVVRDHCGVAEAAVFHVDLHRLEPRLYLAR